jgi:sphingomyelin phosphodiesterase 2
LQEVWSEYDYNKIRNRVNETFPFSHYFYSGVVGSGLCIFSRHQILSVFFHHWAVNGYVHKIQHGDWFGGKGVGMCRIKVQDQVINFYLSHLHAEYSKNCDDYMTHRIIQAFDTAQFLETTRGECSLQILAGDLNTEPQDLAYRVLLSTAGMKDAYEQKPTKFFATHEYKNNTYASKDPANTKAGIRIDYVLYRSGSDYDCEVEEYNLPLLDMIPDHNISYSDHEAVHTRISFKRKEKRSSREIDRTALTDNIKNLKECITTCKNSLKALESHRRSYSMMAIGLVVILINILEISPAYGFKTIYFIVKFLIVGMTIFFAFMASLWNVMEKHGILSGKLAMEIALKRDEAVLTENS